MPYAQRTARLGSSQRHIGLALGGKAGARLAGRIATPVSGSTLLRLVRRGAPVTPGTAPRVLGVDDWAWRRWAWRRGLRYGTVLVDLERRAVVDLLPDREADGFAAWLREHPGVEVIARDRGAGYADGGRRGAPHAVHVADRWHLLENCSAAVLDALRRHLPALRAAAAASPTCDPEPTATRQATDMAATAPVADPACPPPMTSAQRRQWEGWQRRAGLRADAVRLREQGMAVRQIARELALSRNTVRRWLRGEQPELYRSGHGGTRSTPGGRCWSAAGPRAAATAPGSGASCAPPDSRAGCASSPSGPAASGWLNRPRPPPRG
jgi:Transposase/Homeodomain-like domain